MAENSTTSGSEPNGAAEPKRSLREIAEAAYDSSFQDDGDAGAGEPAAAPAEPADGSQPRDQRGRFTSKEAPTGEAAAEPATQPQEKDGQQPQTPTQPAQAASSEAPANWPAADKEAFSKLTPEGQQFLLRRHSEMEGDYQRRVQGNARAAEFASALEPVFRDPIIAGSLQQAGISPYQAIVEWGGMHRRAMSPNVQDRVHLLFELAHRMQIDPAVFTTGQPGPQALSPEELKDPAIKFFADHISRNSHEVQALRGELQRMQQADAVRQQAEAERVSRWSIDTFAEEKGPDGKLLRPDFDQVIDTIIELFKANPQRDLREAYETARWMNPTTRQALVAAERQTVQRQAADRQAAQAVRSNVRGMTAPVSKPPDDGKPKGLRATIEAAAEEIGF